MTTRRTKSFYDEAIRYNKRRAIEIPAFSMCAVDTKCFAKAVSDFQKSSDNLKMDGKLGPTTAAYIRQDLFDNSGKINLDSADYMRIAMIISKFEGRFWSLNRDGEYRGLFDRGDKKHWASGKVHIGLSFGFIQFTQDGGSLGEVLQDMFNNHPMKFEQVFGPHYKELLETTNKKGRGRVNGRSPRVQPVGGHDLWDDYWASRFIRAGKDTDLQKSQLKHAINNYLKPAIKTCQDLNISSERGLAVVFDRSVQYGPAGAKRLIGRIRGDMPEHIFLKHALDEWKGRRWHHRVEKIYKEKSLRDFSSVFT